MTYPGPLYDEPLAVELHNTIYASGGAIRDGLPADADARSWLEALGARLPSGGAGTLPSRERLVELRTVVRTLLHAVVEQTTPARDDLDAINRASARAPRSLAVRWPRGAPPSATTNVHGASRADVVLAAFAADAIRLLTGPQRAELRACRAPGCVLLFVKDHPRREWCSGACGNRARQARHYARTRGQAPSV